MIIGCYNYPGRVGKTSIASAIAKEIDYFYSTNDRSDQSAMDILGDDNCQFLEVGEEIGDIDPTWDIVYDFGGFLDSRAIPVLKQAHCIVVPTILDYSKTEFKTLERTSLAIRDYLEFNTNIVVIANRLGQEPRGIHPDEAFAIIDNFIKKRFPEHKIPVLPLKYSAIFGYMERERDSLSNVAKNAHPLQRKAFRYVAKQFQDIIKHLNSNFSKNG